MREKSSQISAAPASRHRGIPPQLPAARQHRTAERPPTPGSRRSSELVVRGDVGAEAERRYDEQNALLPENHDLDRLSQVLGEDLSVLPLDEPVPAHLLGEVTDPSKFIASLDFRESVVRLIESGGLTLRQAVRGFSGAGHRVIVGSPIDVADTIERWFLAGAADGFNLMPDVFPDGLEIFVDEVVPILRSRGLFRSEYAETTLRERFTGRRTSSDAVALATA